jgi:uncharacterized protein YukE
MSDPLSDPRAHDLLSSQPPEVWSLASQFRRVASEAEGTASGLRSAQNDAHWSGAAATAFRSKIGKLPGELDKVNSSYGAVADALSGYEGQLAPIKSEFTQLAEQLGSARSNLNGAQTQLSGAQSSLHDATSAPHAKPSSPAVQDAHHAVSVAGGNVSRLRGDVSGLESRGYQLLDSFDRMRTMCYWKVISAAGQAPSESFWHHAWHDVTNWMSDAGHFIAAIGKTVWTGVTGLPGAVVDFVEHPSWKTFGKLAEDLAITATVVLMVTGAGEMLLPEEMAAADMLGTAAEGADTVASAAGTAGTASEVGQAGDDALHGNWKMAADDLGHAAVGYAAGKLPEAGDFTAASKAADAAGESSSALGSYMDAINAAGATPARALGSMSSEDRQLVLAAAGLGANGMRGMSAAERSAFLRNMANPTSIAEAAAVNAERLKRAALPGKAGLNFVQDKAVNDPIAEHAKAGVDKALGVTVSE